MEKIVRDNFRMGLNYVRGGGGGAFKAEPHFSAIEFVKFYSGNQDSIRITCLADAANFLSFMLCLDIYILQ